MIIQILGREISDQQLTEARRHLIQLVEQNRGMDVTELERHSDALLIAVKRLPETEMLRLNARTDEDAEWLLGRLTSKLNELTSPARRHVTA